MKKSTILTAAILAAFYVTSCQMPDSDSSYSNSPSSSYSEKVEKEQSEKIDLNENSNENNTEQNTENEKNNTALDFSVTRQYSMNVGDTVSLPDYIGEYEVYYEIQSGLKVCSVSGAGLRADSVGSAIIKATDWNNENHNWYCSVSVTAKGFSGNAIEYKLAGTWKSDDGSSYFTLNENKTGNMKIYLNGSEVQNCSFKWSGYEAGGYKFLKITDGAEYVNKEYTVENISSTSLRLKGYLAFGKPLETSWSK